MRRLRLVGALAFALGVAPALAQTPPSSPAVTPQGPLPFTPSTIWNPADHGAACDGVTNDTAAFSGAPATTPIVISGIGKLCNTTFAFTSTPNALIGPGQLIGGDANHRAPITTNLSSAPSSYGNWSGPATAFNGDLSHTYAPHQHIITGAATLTQPTSGYVLHQETFAHVLDIYNTSGWDNSLSGNSGRTATGGIYVDALQYGQGDLTAIWCNGIVASTKSGATSYLASPAVECEGGELFGGAAGSYIEWLGDMDIADNGYDIAAVGEVFGFTRTEALEGIGANWVGRIVNTSGGLPADALDRISGAFLAGYDLTNATLANYRLASYTLTGGTGSGVVLNDILQATGGTTISNGAATQFQVTGVSGGTVTSLSLVNTGIYSSPPVSSYSSVALTDLTTPAATAPTVSGQYSNNNAMLLPAAGGCIRPGITTGSPLTEMSGIYSGICETPAGITIGGINNVNTAGGGADNVVLGDENNVQGSGNVVLGQYAYDEAQKNAVYWSSGSFAGSGGGRSETSTRLFRNVGATATLRLTADTSAAGSQNVYLAPASSAHTVGWRCNAIDTTTPANTATWSAWRTGALTRGASGNAAYSGAGTSAVAVDQSTGAGSTATMTVVADTTYQGLSFTFTAPSGGDTWRAACRVDIDQLTGT